MRGFSLHLIRSIFILLLIGIIAWLSVVALPWWFYSFLALVAIALFAMVHRHAASTMYVCPACSRTFSISAMVDFISPHTPSGKWLICPHCSRAAFCPVTDKQ